MLNNRKTLKMVQPLKMLLQLAREKGLLSLKEKLMESSPARTQRTRVAQAWARSGSQERESTRLHKALLRVENSASEQQYSQTIR